MLLKLKTSTVNYKKTILKNSNFLNNQNYILGQSEKKKLLSKFFLEYFLIKFYKILSIFLNYTSYFLILI
jgi:hypothetical protein